MLRVRNLSQKQRRGQLGERAAETDEESRRDEHLEVRSSRLHGDTDEQDAASCPDGGTTAIAIRNEWGERQASEGSDAVDGAEETEKTSGRMIEVVLPW